MLHCSDTWTKFLKATTMHLFPKHVKDRLSPTPQSAVVSRRAINTEVPAKTQEYNPDPDRKVYLTTFNRSNPLLRHSREIGRGGKVSEETLEPKRRDEDRDAVNACAPYTESFNHLLRSIPKGNKYAVSLIMERMRGDPPIPMDATTYNLLLEKVVDLRDDIAFKIYEEFKEESQKEDASVRPDLQTFHLMMRACERNGMYERAFHLYTQMKELLALYPDLPMYNTLIGFCAPLHDEAQASFIVEEMKDRGVDPDVHTYNCLMNVFADAPYEVIVQTFEDMIKHRIKPNLRSYNTLMKASQRMWDYDRAFLYFEELKKEGLIPDVVTYNILLSMCRDRLHYVFGTGMYSNVRRTKEQKEVGMKAVAEISLALFAEMEEVEVLPNTYTYNALLSVLAQCHDYRVMDIFNHMKEDDRHDQKNQAHADDLVLSWVSDSGPQATGGATIPKLLAAVDEPDPLDNEARIASKIVKPGLDTYMIMIDASARLRLPKMAFIFFKEMKESGIHPTKEVFLMMMKVCTLDAQKVEALAIYNEAKAMGLLDVDIFNARMDVLANAGDPELFDLFQSLKRDEEGLSLKPTQDSCNVVLKGCYNMKRFAEAMRLYEEMCDPSSAVSPDAMTYALMIDICSLNNNTSLASNFIVHMKNRGVPVTIHTYCRLMNCYVTASDIGVVWIFDDIRKHGPVPNLEAYLILMQFYLKKSDPAIVQLFDEMKASNVEPDLEAYNIMLEYCAALGNHQKSFKYFEELKTRGLNPDINTYNALMKVFAPTGSEFIYKIFEEMTECKVPPDHVTFAILMKHRAGRQCLSAAADQKLIYVDHTVPKLK